MLGITFPIKVSKGSSQHYNPWVSRAERGQLHTASNYFILTLLSIRGRANTTSSRIMTIGHLVHLGSLRGTLLRTLYHYTLRWESKYNKFKNNDHRSPSTSRFIKGYPSKNPVSLYIKIR